MLAIKRVVGDGEVVGGGGTIPPGLEPRGPQDPSLVQELVAEEVDDVLILLPLAAERRRDPDALEPRRRHPRPRPWWRPRRRPAVRVPAVRDLPVHPLRAAGAGLLPRPVVVVVAGHHAPERPGRRVWQFSPAIVVVVVATAGGGTLAVMFYPANAG